MNYKGFSITYDGREWKITGTTAEGLDVEETRRWNDNNPLAAMHLIVDEIIEASKRAAAEQAAAAAKAAAAKATRGKRPIKPKAPEFVLPAGVLLTNWNPNTVLPVPAFFKRKTGCYNRWNNPDEKWDNKSTGAYGYNRKAIAEVGEIYAFGNPVDLEHAKDAQKDVRDAQAALQDWLGTNAARLNTEMDGEKVYVTKHPSGYGRMDIVLKRVEFPYTVDFVAGKTVWSIPNSPLTVAGGSEQFLMEVEKTVLKASGYQEPSEGSVLIIPVSQVTDYKRLEKVVEDAKKREHTVMADARKRWIAIVTPFLQAKDAHEVAMEQYEEDLDNWNAS